LSLREYVIPVGPPPPLRELIRSDLYRNLGAHDYRWRAYRAVWLYSPGFRFLFWLRIAQALRGGGQGQRRGWKRVAFWAAHGIAHHYGYKFGFDIPVSVRIGRGLKLGHFGGVVVQAHVTIGENCTLSHGVTIGAVIDGERKGTPTIGDRVWIGAGAFILGGIRVGNDALIGPSAMVIRDVPENARMVGPEARMVSVEKGSRGYVLRKWETSCASH
jgi:serine O-acetyltransferase